MKRTPLKRRTPLRSRGRKAHREWDAIAAFRVAIHVRSGGYCEARTPSCKPGPHEGTDCHHRWPSDRDKGLHDPSRGVLLCGPAHLYVHGNPSIARMDGLLMRDGDRDPWKEASA